MIQKLLQILKYEFPSYLIKSFKISNFLICCLVNDVVLKTPVVMDSILSCLWGIWPRLRLRGMSWIRIESGVLWLCCFGYFLCTFLPRFWWWGLLSCVLRNSPVIHRNNLFRDQKHPVNLLQWGRACRL